jgi:3-methyladenine DNA glycosylase AlkD
MKSVIADISRELEKNSNSKTREISQKFFKETIKCHGVKTGMVIKIGKEYFKSVKTLSKKEIFDLCEELWQSGFTEESFIACNWSYTLHKQYKPEDFLTFENWINTYVNNWASCDTFCNHTVGEFIEMYPEYLSELKKMAGSENKWVRRAAAVSLIVPAKKGKFLYDVLQIADILLLDKEDMVQKGYGWMLKVASNKHQQEVYEYVVRNKSVMPRTALRYAIEKMPADLKISAMQK